MPQKSYYDLLEIPPTASAHDVKRAFRQQIARYHPDKVQHLGPEFQAMAADRAAELTEAYHVLSDEHRRAEYDQACAAAPAQSLPVDQVEAAAAPAVQQPEPGATSDGEPQRGSQFAQERAGRDEFVRKATLDRFRKAFAQVTGVGYDESYVRGFDFAGIPKSKLFARAKRPRLLGRFVRRVDQTAVAEAWMHAGNWTVPAGEEICVILMGVAAAPARELADAIAEQRRRHPRAGKLTLIPVNVSIWEAHMPTDAPGVARELLTRLGREP